jgi:sulfite exporter TauE/SafE
MKLNMGSIDRVLRFIAGVVVMALGYYYESWWGAVGLIPFLTAFVGWCPAYVPFKFSTKKSE